MPRKKPFSVKQKKKQLQEKRKRKQDTHCSDSEENEHRELDTREATTSHQYEELTDVLNVQTERSVSSNSSSSTCQELKNINHDPNKYRLLFLKQTKDEIKKRKELTRHPYEMLSEDCLEVDIDDIYKPGTVLDIPKRPSWSMSLTKQSLELQEELYFKDYLEKIFGKYSCRELSYFELNLETWRQLWRVTEMSDILLLITDIRHPALHFPPALYDHVTSDLNKPMILILNKTDLAHPSLVVAWKHYFQHRFPKLHIICFTSHTKLSTSALQCGDTVLYRKKRKCKRLPATGPKELYEACKQMVQGKVDLDKWKSLFEESHDLDKCGHLETESEVDMSFAQHHQFRDGILTIGCVGYPNVGKSSMINGLVGRKVVSVSKTPGHTKHFQTIFLTPTVKLCDCPGLVFPSLIEKPLQILSGIYPIAQVREPYSAVHFLTERIPLPKILKLQIQTNQTRLKKDEFQWTAFDICEAWALKCGFITAKGGRPDTYRAANYILRLAVEGRLRLCFSPPQYVHKKEFWLCHPETQKILEAQKSLECDDSDEDLATDSSEDNIEEEAGSSTNQKRSNCTPDIVSSNPFALLCEDY